MYAYALKIYQKIRTKIACFSNQSEFLKKSIMRLRAEHRAAALLLYR